MSIEVDPRIPGKLYFRIGEVCDLIKVQPHVLRYWESEFPMLAPQKNRAGQRVYRRKDVEMVFRIRDLLYEEQFTIAGAKKKLLDEMRKGGAPRTGPVAEPVIEPVEEVETITVTESITVTPSTGRSPRSRRAIGDIRRELEALLTLLNGDASIRR